MKKSILVGVLASLLVQTGCAGVPSLDLVKRHPGAAPTYKVEDIINHATCELRSAAKSYPVLTTKEYAVTLLLTLRVNDALDLTPSLTLINPLKNEKYSFSGALSADFGGARERTFTTQFTIDAARLDSANWCDTSPADYEHKAYYQLDGRLGLEEVVRDGLGAVASHRVTLLNPKAATTFGSQIQFTITRALTGLGPMWSVRRLKGPSGSNGLLNGKRNSVDSLTLTFAPAPPPQGPSKEQLDAQKRLAAAAFQQEVADSRKLTAARTLETATRDADLVARSAQEQLRRLQSKNLSALQSRRINGPVEDARRAADQARAELQASEAAERLAAAESQAALAEREQADRDASQAASASAALNSQNLLTTILLQNIGNRGEIQ